MGYALVTGASGGIGEAMCEVLAGHGHDLVLVARNEEKLRQLADRLSAHYGVATAPVALDLTDEKSCTRLHDITQEAGIQVDVLVNNAGFGDHAAFLDSNWEKQRRMVELDVLALMKLTYLYGNDMREAGCGRVLNMSSVAAFSGGPYMSVYYASKGFVLQFSQAVHYELRGTGVTVTALCPGPTSTGFEKAAGGMKDSRMFSFMGAQDAHDVARRGYEAMMAGKPVAYHSPATRVLSFGSRFVPLSVASRFAGFVNGKPKEQSK